MKFSTFNYYGRLISVFYKSTALVPILRNKLVYAFMSYFCIYFNITVPSAPMFSKWFFPLAFENNFFHISYLLHAVCPVNFVLLVLNTLGIVGEEKTLCSSAVCRFLQALASSLPFTVYRKQFS
jgi:hypothetical protein